MRLFELFDKAKPDLDIPRDQMPQISRKDLDGHDIEKIQLSLDSLTPCQQQRVPGLVDQSVEQIQHRGSVKPLIVDCDCRIVNGHHRWDACQQLGIKMVPVIRVKDATVWDLMEEFSHTTSDEFAEGQDLVGLDEAKMPLYKVIEFYLQFHRKYGGDPQRNLWKVSRIADVNYRDLERELHQQIALGRVPNELAFRRDLLVSEQHKQMQGATDMRFTEIIQEQKMITEEEFDEAAGKKDACYHKVKSRYKVWPSAYASGALVQCRKVGAKNWGNKSKSKKSKSKSKKSKSKSKKSKSKK